MKLLDSITIQTDQTKRIELHQGDLTALTPSEKFDLLIVSAFPNDYTPTPSSLIGALAGQGLWVETLAHDKDIDLRQNFSCWLSKEFRCPNPHIQFTRVLCFEPLVRGKPPEVVGDIFRALTPILAERPSIKTVAMPLVAAGDQGYTPAQMLTPLLDAAIHWLTIGLPLNCIRIVTFSKEQTEEAIKIFSEKKVQYSKLDSAFEAGGTEFDVFISYSRRNSDECSALERALRSAMPGIKIFVDRNDIDIGSAWQPEIFENIDKCKKVAVLLSPDYLASKVCKEEFNIAWIRGRETEKNVIFPIYLYSTKLPTYMIYKAFFDCREGDNHKIIEASQRLVSELIPGRIAQRPLSTE
ncbi:MAG: toll/interleukin-1 receptor domain-containing protein [Alphaproteobacteria bacterium]|nr:toll/interleukin-1 receptor domain-containing protein [Alphaproteobacteria bacterium]